MKQLQLLLSLITISVLPLHAQITITASDMPSVGKTYIISQSLEFAKVDPTLTGPDFTWDFSNLNNSVQQIDSIKAITAAPQMYQIVFNSYLEPKPTFCTPRSHMDALDSITQFDPTEIYEYYRTSSQHFSYAGFGMKLQGVAVPIKYDTVDILYTFPLTYGNSDSTTSFFETPSILSPYLYFASHKTRKNSVDGWGTLKTPFGSFSAIRLKSTISSVDTIYQTAIDSGYKYHTTARFEYRWLGQNSGIPLMQVYTELIDTLEVVTAIYYQDSTRINSISNFHHNPLKIKIYPNPFYQTATIEYTVDHYSYVSVELIDLSGKIISKIESGYVNPGIYKLPINIDNNRSSVYFIKFRLNDQVHLEKLSNIR